MISENYEGKVIDGKVIASVGMIPDLNVIHVVFSDDTFGRYGSVEALEAVIEEVDITEEEAEVTRAAEVENKRQEEEDAEIERQAKEREAVKPAEGDGINLTNDAQAIESETLTETEPQNTTHNDNPDSVASAGGVLGAIKNVVTSNKE